MKHTLLTVVSICLIAACVFGLVAGAGGMRDAKNAREDVQADAGEALRSMDELLDEISRLQDDEDTYTEGVSTYEAGLIDYQNGEAMVAAGGQAVAQGEAQLAANKPALDAGEQSYSAGAAQLAAAKQQLEEGEAAYAAGQAELEAGRAAYDEGAQKLESGKEMLAKVEPVYNVVRPAYDQYLSEKAAYDEAVANGDEALAASLWKRVEAQRLIYQTQLAGYSIEGLLQQYEASQAEIAEGEAQLAEAEQQLAEAEQQLAAARQQLDEGHAAYAAGEAQLAQGKRALDAGRAAYASGKQQLATAKAEIDDEQQQLVEDAERLDADRRQLTAFESDAGQVAAEIVQLLRLPEYRNRWNSDKGEVICPSVLDIVRERLGADFDPGKDIWQKGEDGEVLVLNDKQYLDLTVCTEITRAARDYISEYRAEAVENEVRGRLTLYLCLLVIAAVGVVTGLFGLLCSRRPTGGKLRVAAILGWASAALAAAGVVFARVRGDFAGYAFANHLENGNELWTGRQQTGALVWILVAAILFALVVSGVRRKYRVSRAAVEADAYRAAASVAEPVEAPIAEPFGADMTVAEAADIARAAAAEAARAAEAGDVETARAAAKAAADAAEAAARAAGQG